MMKLNYRIKPRLPPTEKSGSEKEIPLKIAVLAGQLKVYDLTNVVALELADLKIPDNRTFVAGKGYVANDYFSRKVKNLKNEDKKMPAYYRRGKTPKGSPSKPPKHPEKFVERSPVTDFNFALSMVYAAVENQAEAKDWRNENSDKFDISNRHKLAYDLKKFGQARGLLSDNTRLAGEYIREVFGLHLVKIDENDVPNITRNKDFFDGQAFAKLGDNKTAAVFYGRWARNQMNNIDDYIVKRHGHVHAQMRTIDSYLHNDGSVKGHTVEEVTKNAKIVFDGGNFGGRDNMRRTIKVLRYENRALRKIISVLPTFSTPDVKTIERSAFSNLYLLVPPPDSLDILGSKLATLNSKTHLLGKSLSVNVKRVEQLREETAKLFKDMWTVLEESLDFEHQIEGLENYIETRNSHPEWFNKDGEYTIDDKKLSVAIAKHRNDWLSKKNLTKEGTYNFKGQYLQVEQVAVSDYNVPEYEFADSGYGLQAKFIGFSEVLPEGRTVIKDVFNNEYDSEGNVAGKTMVMRDVMIRSLNVEDRRRLDLWRKANDAGIYNVDGYSLAEGEEFPTLSNRMINMPISNILYSVAMVIAFAIRTVLFSILPEMVNNWEIRNSAFRLIPQPDVINLGYHLSEPIYNGLIAAENIANFTQETAKDVISIFKPSFTEIKNAHVNTFQVTHNLPRPIQEVINWNTWFDEHKTKMEKQSWVGFPIVPRDRNDKPVFSQREWVISVGQLILKNSGYQLLSDLVYGNYVHDYELIPYVDVIKQSVNNRALADSKREERKETAKRFASDPELALVASNWQPNSWSDEETEAFNSVDTSGLEVPQVIDAPHEVLAEHKFDNNLALPPNFELAEQEFLRGVDDILVKDLVNTQANAETKVVIPDEIIFATPQKLNVRVRDIHDRIMDVGMKLDTANHTNFSLLIYGVDENVDRETIHDTLANCLEQFLDRLEIKAEPYLGTLMKLMVQLEYRNFHAITLFPLLGIKEDLALEMYLALTGIGIHCAAIKAPHHNFAGSSRDGYAEQLTYLEYGSEVAGNCGDGLSFDAQHVSAKHQDAEWMFISNAVPIYGKLNGTEETYIAVSVINNRDEFTGSLFMPLPAKSLSTEIKEGDFSPLEIPTGFSETKINGIPIILPNSIGVVNELPAGGELPLAA